MTDRGPTRVRRWHSRRLSVCGWFTASGSTCKELPDRPARLDKAFKSELRSRTTGRSSGAGHGAPVRRRLARARRCQRSRLVIHLDQGVNRLKGPLSLPNWRVLSAWIPAWCSPLKRLLCWGNLPLERLRANQTISRGGMCGLARSPGSLTHPGTEVDCARRELVGRRGAGLL
jgi:hypothetical protein